MECLLTPYNKNTEPYAWWENAFNDEELAWLQRKTLEGSEPAKIGGGTPGGVVDPNVRRSDINWLSYKNQENQWLFHKLSHVVSSLNSQFFHFDLTGFGENIQLTNYDGNQKGMYGWHVDFGNQVDRPSRKLSLVLQLSDPVDYEGGVLELKINNDHPIKMRKQRGLIVCFPSWTLHQVTPVTSGIRQSLVAWITGPSFK